METHLDFDINSQEPSFWDNMIKALEIVTQRRDALREHQILTEDEIIAVAFGSLSLRGAHARATSNMPSIRKAKNQIEQAVKDNQDILKKIEEAKGEMAVRMSDHEETMHSLRDTLYRAIEDALPDA